MVFATFIFTMVVIIAVSIMAFITNFVPANVTVVLLDVHGDELPTKYMDILTVQLVRYPEPGNLEDTSYLGLISGEVYYNVSPGEYDLQVRYAPSESSPIDNNVLLYERKVFLLGGAHTYEEVYLDNVALCYDVVIAPLGDKLIIPTNERVTIDLVNTPWEK
jgi:hypothetical protein